MKTQIMNLFRMMEKSGEMGKSLKSLKSLMQIFATYATYASAIFVGKASNESTVRYALWSRISLTKPLLNPYLTLTRFRLSLGSNLSRISLASLICLCMLTVGVGNVWADYTVGFATSGSDVISSGGNYVSSSPRGGYTNIESSGLRFGSGGNTGSITVNLTSSGTYIGQIKASKITLNGVVRYGSDASVTVKTTITYTGTDGSKEDTYTAPTSAGTHDIELDGTKTIKSVKIESTANSKRFYCTGFTVTAAAVIAVTGVTVDPTSKAIVVGESFSVTPTVSPSNASNKNINWSTSNSSYATVSSGTVTGVAAGSASITATSAADGTKSASCAVSVYSVTVQVKDEDGNTLSGAGMPTASAIGRTLTASASGNNYVFKQWEAVTAAGTSFAASGSASTTLNGTPTGNVTIKAVYYKPISVSWMVAGSAWNDKGGTVTVAYGTAWSSLTLPSDPGSTQLSGCDADKFVGWTPAEISGKLDKDDDAAAISTLESNNLLNSGNKSSKTGKTITTATTFYAVFVDYIE